MQCMVNVMQMRKLVQHHMHTAGRTKAVHYPDTSTMTLATRVLPCLRCHQ